MSYLITGKLFFDWAEVWAEFAQTMVAGRLSPQHNEEATKMLSQIPLEMLGPHAFAVANRPVNYSKTPKSEDL